MNSIHTGQRRFSRWHEVVIFNGLFQYVLGLALVAALPAYIRWPNAWMHWPLRDVILNTLVASVSSHTLCTLILRKLKHHPGTQSLPFVVPTLVVVWLVAFSVFVFIREPNYSRLVLGISFSVALAWAFVGQLLERRFRQRKLAMVPFGRALELPDGGTAHITRLDSPDFKGCRYDGVVADLRSPELDDQWQYFLAQCTLARIPVYHSRQVMESLTGRVRIDHLSENIFGELLPSTLYSGLKRAVDIMLALALIPILLPIMAVTALLIAIDSPGGVFFNQQRMGYRGWAFKMYKFRSMHQDTPGKGFTESEDDPRITRVGRVIRKFRIDELPQVFNVLKGNMSFIGPRPESLQLSQWYEKEVPFFSYRHTVRPGISGWAQVNQGYAAEVDGMREKLEFDFYYIKHFSPWLDILIIGKTIKTILTGFGSR